MKKKSQKALIFTIILVLGSWTLVHHLAEDKVSPLLRGPASLQNEAEVTDWKEFVSSKLQLVPSENQVNLSLYVEGHDLCELWGSMQVTFRSEGIAYSGEPSRLRQVKVCEDLGFNQEWPRSLMEDHEGIQKVGHFEDEPSEWGLEEVKLMGPHGTLTLSGAEVFQYTGVTFFIETAVPDEP